MNGSFEYMNHSFLNFLPKVTTNSSRNLHELWRPVF